MNEDITKIFDFTNKDKLKSFQDEIIGILQERLPKDVLINNRIEKLIRLVISETLKEMMIKYEKADLK